MGLFWVVQGAVVADNKLALTAVRVNATPGEGLGFAVVGTALLVVEMIGDNPTEWPYSCSDVPLPGYLWTMALTLATLCQWALSSRHVFRVDRNKGVLPPLTRFTRLDTFSG